MTALETAFVVASLMWSGFVTLWIAFVFAMVLSGDPKPGRFWAAATAIMATTVAGAVTTIAAVVLVWRQLGG
jgi:hypothetical protein